MIDIHVSVALHLSDGFNGRPLKPAQVRLSVDGEPVRAVCKEGGWFVLVNLSPGAHALRVEGEGFQPEELTVQGGNAGDEMQLRLLPAPSYRFGRRVTTLTVRLRKKDGAPAAGRRIYALGSGRCALRLAQDDAGPGALSLRLFSEEKPALLPIPGAFYLEDGEKGELVNLLPGQGMTFSLETPLTQEHRRGCLLRPAAVCRADAEGEVFLALADGDAAVLLAEAEGVPLRRLELALRPWEHNTCDLVLD